MQVQLTIARSALLTGIDAAGWFIPGSQPASWLAEIVGWQCATHALRLFVIPGRDSGEPLGVVVSGVERHASGCAQAYRMVGQRLLIPREAELVPHVSESELLDLLVTDLIEQFVWHPVAGLVGFEPQQVLSVDQLLSVSLAGDGSWYAGNAGLRLSDRLVSVTPAATMTLGQVLGQGGGDIGTEESLDGLPRSPDESSTAGIRDGLRGLQRPFARAVERLVQSVPGTADRRTWIDAIGEWAQRVLRDGATSSSRRANELRRLMHMLDDDPDKGLRYAIPFGGENQHRGLAAPSDRLVDGGMPDYGRPGGGGAADYWDMPWEMQNALLTRYRELAERESRMGRHRRAAHIYANLLGDFHGAASALRTGGHFREAAVLYKDKLHQSRKAAECLTAAGLWTESLEIYEELGDWEQVAELYEKLDDAKHADRAWRKAVESSENHADYLRAATLLEEKLGDVAAAGLDLKQGWLSARDPKKCLAALFDLFARHEDAKAAHSQIEALLDSRYESAQRDASAAETLVNVAAAFPAEDVRSSAAMATRRITARNLTRNMARDRFLRVLKSLQPNDQLLNRDCYRFTRVEKRDGPHEMSRGKVEFVNRSVLGKETSWQATAHDHVWLYIAGYRGDAFVVATTKFNSNASERVEYYVPPGLEPRILMSAAAASEVPERSLMLHLETDVIRKDFTKKGGPVPERIRNAPSSDSRALTVTRHGVSWLVFEVASGIRLSSFNVAEVPIASHSVPLGLSPPTDGHLFVAQTGMFVCVAGGDSLLTMDLTGNRSEAGSLTVVDTSASESAVGFASEHLPQVVVSMSESPSATSPRIAVSFDDGGLIYCPETGESARFGFGLVRPVTAFTEQNDLIAADAHGVIEVYQLTDSKPDLVATLNPRSVRVVGIETLDGGRFCVCYEDGTIDSYRLHR